jgi:hypothetical protein
MLLKLSSAQEWWYICAFLAPGRLRQEVYEFEVNLGHIAKPSLQKLKQTNEKSLSLSTSLYF